MEPLLLEGSAAFSDFRVASLLNNINIQAPELEIKNITTRFIFFVEHEKTLSPDIHNKTIAILGSSGEYKKNNGFFVTPRKGTISPWSSKATDIFHNCGLNEILRVERGIFISLFNASGNILSIEQIHPVSDILHDRMTEGIYSNISDIFIRMEPTPCITVDVMSKGKKALHKANIQMGLALSDEEIEYLSASYLAAKRNPTDVELVMFGQVNSEHCRHKIFNANWIIDGEKKNKSLFDMIQNTHKKNPGKTLVAYSDNSGVTTGFKDKWFQVKRDGSNKYEFSPEQIDMIMKVETHNHPTAISPFPGAATGVGGEIRDEGATGTGSKSKAGLSAFMVSNLRIPGFIMPWEDNSAEHPARLATPLEIMTDGPIGGANFGNEFGRPQLLGLFKTYEQELSGRLFGYHKPIMVAGGMGNIKRKHVHKNDITEGSFIIQIGGPAMKIGLGGGAASSMDTGSNAAELDFDSVQRGNAEMERRCQEVIDACIALDKENPILSIHDIGAGGLSNGCPELVEETGGTFSLRAIHNEDISMSPMEIWCCEAQERYVLAVSPESLDGFLDLCKRERCPVAVVGKATGDGHLSLDDDHFGNKPIDIDLSVILGKPPKMLRDVSHVDIQYADLNLSGVSLTEAAERVLQLPAVANKTFLITITDRSITGMVARDQMVGPFQTPVADSAVTTTSFTSSTGEAMSMGERTCLALISAPASGRMAVGEALTNLAGTFIGDIANIKLSANWMCACGEDGEDANLFDTVKAVGMELCPSLGISIPVGKDSLSMRTLWDTSDGKARKMTAPLSLVITAFSTVEDVRKTVTPNLKPGNSSLILIDLGSGKNRLGGSSLAQVYNQIGNECPDLDNPDLFVHFFAAMQELISKNLLMAYHDRSDGGLFVTLAEMAFSGRTGISVVLDEFGADLIPSLFSEELGAVLQVAESNEEQVQQILDLHGLSSISHVIGAPTEDKSFDLMHGGNVVFSESTAQLNRIWSELTFRMQQHRDNPVCAEQEYGNLLDEEDPGMQFNLTYNPSVPHIVSSRPKMAVLREQGINGQVEMAAAFDMAGFETYDVHMTDLLSERTDLNDFAGLVACGGFSYGDVLGAGSGWAKSILLNSRLKEMFAKFFARNETFTLGVCNGCQMISQLKKIIPGADLWPAFINNNSEQFEARYVTVQVESSPSIFFKGMDGSRIGIPVAHGEGRIELSDVGNIDELKTANLISLRYVDNYGDVTEQYPFNPNGSPNGITSLTTTDGRVTIMMPHPERAFRSMQLSYRPAGFCDGEEGPWLRMFQNARKFV